MTNSGSKRKSSEFILGEFGFHILWEVEDHWANFKAYKTTGGDEYGNPTYDLSDVSYSPAPTTDMAKAEEYLSGYIKWDGCTEIDFGSYHWCEPRDWVKHCWMLRHIYHKAFELMGREPEASWPSIQEAVR